MRKTFALRISTLTRGIILFDGPARAGRLYRSGGIMKTEKSDRIGGEKMEALRALLKTAAHIVEALAADPVRERLLRVYEKVPMQDRAALLDVLEREVSFRLATRGEGRAITGCGARINPNARLYLRVIDRKSVV